MAVGSVGPCYGDPDAGPRRAEGVLLLNCAGRSLRFLSVDTIGVPFFKV